MSTASRPPLNVDEVQRLVKQVAPAAFLVPPRLLRRVIKEDRDIGGIGLLLPHRKGFVASRAVLSRCVQPAELGLADNAELPAHAFLMVRPENHRLALYSADQALVKYWIILFHLHIDWAMQQKFSAGTLTTDMVRERIGRLGLTEFAEITAVLRQEKYLLPPESIESVYAEFVAVYLTLRRFAPARLPHFFPVVRDPAAVDAVLAQDVDAAAIFQATRLPGAPDPASVPPRITEADGLLGAALKMVRPAPVPDDSPGELSELGNRLKAALAMSDADAENWRKSLLPLLAFSGRGWSQEARFLYDLQSVCVASEHGIYTVDVVGAIVSLGQLSIKRRLPGHQEVVIVRHLRRALDRMRLLRLGDEERNRLMHLLGHAVEQRERLMREKFRPLLTTALDEVGLKPHNVAEEIGRAKLIEELLDRVVEHGHFNIGNLRDAMSSNDLKLPDLAGAAELALGDPLIRLNRQLAVAMDGVYRRGEIYMRLLHRLSSVAFGTFLGRMLVLYLILPFGLAFFAMITPGIAVEEGQKIAQMVGLMEHKEEERGRRREERERAKTEEGRTGEGEKGTGGERDRGRKGEEEAGKMGEWEGYRGDVDDGNEGEDDDEEMSAPVSPSPPVPVSPSPPPHPPGARHRHQFPMPNWWGVAGLGVFFLLLIHVRSFRSQVFYGMGKVGQGLQIVFIDAPVWLVNLPALQAILHNRFWIYFRRFVFWPLLTAVAGGLSASWIDPIAPVIIGAAAVCLILCIVVMNTRLGRDLEEAATDWLLRLWVWISVDFVPGLLLLIMDVSRWCLEAIEQMLYAVNEWLRFRSGENQVVVVIKAGLGLVWFGVTYVIRFAINLIIEPQINPIKHFPVVTVCHKICLPLTPAFSDVLMSQFGLGKRRAFALAGGIITGTPGIFGFMAWELKENWKLYASNRPANLKPILIGSHGETMLRLLRPGFHSGTVPKLYRKLRRAERLGKQRTIRKILTELHHVAERIAYFVERELLALLRQSRSWGGLAIELAHVHLATNRVLMELCCPALGEQPLLLAFEQREGWLLAGVLKAGWLPGLSAGQRQTLESALAGLYKMAGVHLTREQIAANLPAATFAFDITNTGLAVWTAVEPGRDVVYNLSETPKLPPKPLNGSLPAGLPVLDADRLLFMNMPVPWQDWVKAWKEDRVMATPPHLLAVSLLPLRNGSPGA